MFPCGNVPVIFQVGHVIYFPVNSGITVNNVSAEIGSFGSKAGGVAEWFRALDLKSGGPWFKSSTLPLSGFVLGSPEFNSSTSLCK